jgi:hypothetical protein
MFYVLLVGFPVLGLLLARWPVVMGPLIAWPLYLVGLNEGWWGSATWESYGLGAVMVATAIGAGTTAFAVWVGRAISLPASSSGK